MPSESIIMILGACLTALMQRASQVQSCQLEGGESWANCTAATSIQKQH